MSRFGRGLFLPSAMTLGYLFLYVPIVSVVVYSFNESRLVTVWSHFSTQWYGALLHDDAMLRAAWLSVRLGVAAATGAVVLGTVAGFVMARFGGFRGRTLLSGMVSAPLVMPEVIQAISLLLLFVALEQAFGWPERGFVTLLIAHITFTMCFVSVIVQSRLAGMDRSIEEAALDLGAPPLKVFFVITLPLIAPSLVSGWLLALSISMDDVVISQFVSGPGTSTLPLLVFSSVKLGVNPEINALGTLIIGIVAVATLIGGVVISRRERARLADSQRAAASEPVANRYPAAATAAVAAA